ncbi:MAG TPA: DASS family sodium-coupled anion symporter [bacterium]|nr:DASS family sodium-coupled anion symporter [bacterium]
MSDKTDKIKLSGYDKFINWKLFSIPLGLLLLLIVIPTPRSMLDVGVEYSMGPKYAQEFFASRLFGMKVTELAQWQVQMVRMMEQSVRNASFLQETFLKRNRRWCEQNGIPCTPEHLEQVREFARQIPPDDFTKILKEGHALVTEKLAFDQLSDEEKAEAQTAGFHVQAAVGIMLFVIFCFMTEAIPLPMVAFCIGVIALMAGIVDRNSVAALYWSDATWFIMGSLMFATAFVKTGLDKRIAMMMFGNLKHPDIQWVTLIIILTVSPLTMFMSDHALTAMFLPIGIILYTGTVNVSGKDDPELAKILMMTIAMAANLGGSLAPSGGARNLIMMGYTEDMFGISITFMQWVIYCAPFLLFLMPVTWVVLNWRFHPTQRNLANALTLVKTEVKKVRGGTWTRPEKISVVIFLVTLFAWITENNLILKLTGIRFGIGVLAVMGGIAYVFAGVVNWRDYQTNIDWGVVWLYAGAIIFGRVLMQTGAAYWLAQTVLRLTMPLGFGEGLGLLLSGSVIVGLITQLMADGPACAAVGPVTMAMAGITHPGTSMIPFMAMSTSIASSFAYCLIIGTPPNAIVYASGYLKAKDFLRAGVILWFTNMAGLMLLSATYWRWIGFPGLPNY